MKHAYLEVTYRKGRPLAAYYHLPRRDGDKSARTEPADGGLLVDYSIDGRAIGIEIPSPSTLDIAALNRLLKRLNQRAADPAEFAPLHAA